MLNSKNNWARYLLFAYFAVTRHHVGSQYTERRWNHGGEDFSTPFTSFSTFSVINQGRLQHHMVLMYFENMGFEECLENCMRHLRCRSVNYNNDQKICEVCDSDFDLLEADTETTGWQNFAKDLKRVDGGFTPWLKVGECTKKCGGGVQLFYRSCENPEPRNGGEPCYGKNTKEERCNEDPCPVDGNWGDWKVGECTKKCGGGVQLFYRSCENPEPHNGGEPCHGKNTKEERCNENPCLPVHGNWGAWENNGGCFEGFQSKRRMCNNPPPSYNGLECRTGYGYAMVDYWVVACKPTG